MYEIFVDGVSQIVVPDWYNMIWWLENWDGSNDKIEILKREK